MTESDAELLRRVRAARGYAGLSHEALGHKLGQSESTIKRRATELPAQGNKKRAYLQQVAAACGLPIEFFTVDFGRLPELEQSAPATTQTALDAIQDDLRLIRARLATVEAAMIPPSPEEPGTTEDLPGSQRI